MAISAKDVMTLRQRTGVGMMECKAALEETRGDFDAAIEMLREKLKGDMEERSDRQASEGAIAIARGDGSVAMIELLSETDFTGRNESFLAGAEKIAQLALACDNGEVTLNSEMESIVDDLRITIKENITVGRGIKYSGGTLGSYLHHNHKIGAIIQGEGDMSEDLLRGLCQHIAAAVPPLVPQPLAVDEKGLAPELIDQQKANFVEEAKDSGKPDSIIEKMVTGKLRKWINENTLLGQTYIRELDAKKSVGSYLPDGATIQQFVRFELGA